MPGKAELILSGCAGLFTAVTHKAASRTCNIICAVFCTVDCTVDSGKEKLISKNNNKRERQAPFEAC